MQIELAQAICSDTRTSLKLCANNLKWKLFVVLTRVACLMGQRDFARAVGVGAI